MHKFGAPAKTIPEPLKPGDTIGVIAPGSAISQDLLSRGCSSLRALGYSPFYFDSILEKELYFAGSHKRRAWELEQMFLRSDVKAIICARGGYGCNHLLPLINLDVVRDNPKLFMGYSDVTTLLTYFCDHADLVTYHGPMVAKDFAEAVSPENSLAGANESRAITHEGPQLKTGNAQGVLYGGCLSMLAASLGTPYEIQTDNSILFLEDINTKPYQLDRMLMQLKLAGKLKGVRAVVFGEMLDCLQPGGQEYTLQEVILSVLGDLETPLAYGLRSGHVSSAPNHILPIGVNAKLTVTQDKAVLKF
jgi:muramoyltetrapeptide carboxypeptidase